MGLPYSLCFRPDGMDTGTYPSHHVSDRVRFSEQRRISKCRSPTTPTSLPTRSRRERRGPGVATKEW
jgi:hypothetical protein